MFFILLWVKILPSSLHVGLWKKTVHECLTAKYCRYHNSCFDRISIHSPGCLKLKVALLQLASDGFHVCTTLSSCCLLPNTHDASHTTHIIYASKVGIEVSLKTSFWTHGKCEEVPLRGNSSTLLTLTLTEHPEVGEVRQARERVSQWPLQS